MAEPLVTLMSMVDWNVWPELSPAELDQALADAACEDTAGNPPANLSTVAAWQTVHTYTAGTVVKNTAVRFFKCVVAGVSGGTEPAWPDLSGQPRSPHFLVVDGGVVWADNGGLWATGYDLAYAAYRSWLLKAGKAAAATDFRVEAQAFDRAMVHTHCLAQAGRYAVQRVMVA